MVYFCCSITAELEGQSRFVRHIVLYYRPTIHMLACRSLPRRLKLTAFPHDSDAENWGEALSVMLNCRYNQRRDVNYYDHNNHRNTSLSFSARSRPL